MSSLLRKTWLIFYIITFSGLLTLLTASYLKYHELEHGLKNDHYYVTQLFNSHISSAFFQFEAMLDLIIYEYSHQESLEIDVITEILSKSDLLIGFAIFNPDGSLQSASRNLRSVKLPNLLKNTET